MKKIILLVVVTVLSASCKKTAQPEKHNHLTIVGKWKLSDYYASPGSGVDIHSIPWSPVSSSSPDKYIEFTTDGKFKNSADYFLVPDSYSATDSSLIISRGAKQMYLGYKITGSYLEIYGNISYDAICIEFCGTRYTSVDQ